MSTLPYQFQGSSPVPSSTASSSPPVHSLRKRRHSLDKRQEVTKTRKYGSCESCRKRKIRCPHKSLEFILNKRHKSSGIDMSLTVHPSSIIEVHGSDIFGMRVQPASDVVIDHHFDFHHPPTITETSEQDSNLLTPERITPEKMITSSMESLSLYTTPKVERNASQHLNLPTPEATPTTVSKSRYNLRSSSLAVNRQEQYKDSMKHRLSNNSLQPTEVAIQPPRKNNRSWGKKMGKAMLAKFAALNSMVASSSVDGSPPTPDMVAEKLSLCSLECSLDNSLVQSVEDLSLVDVEVAVKDDPTKEKVTDGYAEETIWENEDTVHDAHADKHSPSAWMAYFQSPKVGESATTPFLDWADYCDESTLYEDNQEEHMFGLGINAVGDEKKKKGSTNHSKFPKRTSSLAASKADWVEIIADDQKSSGTPSKGSQKVTVTGDEMEMAEPFAVRRKLRSRKVDNLPSPLGSEL